MAYQSDESGQAEIYVRTFPNVQDRKWSISSTGGSTPVWSRDGRELFFLDGETHLSRVTVQTGSRFDASRPERVLEQPFFSLGRDRRSYDVSADGSRFLMIEEIQDGDKPREIQVVLNWLDEVERLIAEATH